MLRNIKYFIIALPALILVILPEISSSRQIPYSESGLYRGSVGVPVMSPDGLSFYSNISVYDPATGSRRRGLTRFDFDGKELENDLPLTGLFSPDGVEIAFRANREGNQVYGFTIFKVKNIALLRVFRQATHFSGTGQIKTSSGHRTVNLLPALPQKKNRNHRNQT